MVGIESCCPKACRIGGRAYSVTCVYNTALHRATWNLPLSLSSVSQTRESQSAVAIPPWMSFSPCMLSTSMFARFGYDWVLTMDVELKHECCHKYLMYAGLSMNQYVKTAGGTVCRRLRHGEAIARHQNVPTPLFCRRRFTAMPFFSSRIQIIIRDALMTAMNRMENNVSFHESFIISFSSFNVFMSLLSHSLSIVYRLQTDIMRSLQHLDWKRVGF